jgi:hypothetical protein
MAASIDLLLTEIARHGARLVIENDAVTLKGDLPAPLLKRLHRQRRRLRGSGLL